MDFAGDEIDPGQQADRAVALVFNSRVKSGARQALRKSGAVVHR